MKRKILVILSNRLNRRQKPRHFELECDDKGNILKQRPLRAQPKEARFDEVWENEEGKTDIASTHRFKRKYRHALEKPKRG
ncbi:MAG: hypothetical protein HYY24_06520 [Verrucomicrobia bacterium]|nr:hypothetical protein [Verrucomicrobiota bacterium]